MPKQPKTNRHPRAITIEEIRKNSPEIIRQLTEIGLNRCHVMTALPGEKFIGCERTPVIALHDRDGFWKWMCKEHGKRFCENRGIAMPTLPEDVN